MLKLFFMFLCFVIYDKIICYLFKIVKCTFTKGSISIYFVLMYQLWIGDTILVFPCVYHLFSPVVSTEVRIVIFLKLVNYLCFPIVAQCLSSLTHNQIACVGVVGSIKRSAPLTPVIKKNVQLPVLVYYTYTYTGYTPQHFLRMRPVTAPHLFLSAATEAVTRLKEKQDEYLSIAINFQLL